MVFWKRMVSRAWLSVERLEEASTQLHGEGMFATPAGHEGIAFVAASGDTGDPPGYPATSPNVLAVGGTKLPPGSDGNPDRQLEIGWTGSGGGLSTVFSEPSWQQPVVPLNLDPT